MLKHSTLAKNISERIGHALTWVPLHPDSISILSVVLSLFAFIAWLDPVLRIPAFVLFVFSFFFDVADGAIARAKKLESKKGAFLDGVADRIVEFFLILALFSVASADLQVVLILILFFGTAMTAFVKAYAEHSKILKHKEALQMPGLLERTERSVLLLAAMLLFISHVENVFTILLYGIAVLSILTFLQRFFTVYLKPRISP